VIASLCLRCVAGRHGGAMMAMMAVLIVVGVHIEGFTAKVCLTLKYYNAVYPVISAVIAANR